MVVVVVVVLRILAEISDLAPRNFLKQLALAAAGGCGGWGGGI